MILTLKINQIDQIFSLGDVTPKKIREALKISEKAERGELSTIDMLRFVSMSFDVAFSLNQLFQNKSQAEIANTCFEVALHIIRSAIQSMGTKMNTGASGAQTAPLEASIKELYFVLIKQG